MSASEAGDPIHRVRKGGGLARAPRSLALTRFVVCLCGFVIGSRPCICRVVRVQIVIPGASSCVCAGAAWVMFERGPVPVGRIFETGSFVFSGVSWKVFGLSRCFVSYGLISVF